MASWTGKGDHKHWADPANWSAGVPGPGVDANFGPGVRANVVLDGANPLTTGALVVTNATFTLRAGTLNLAPVAASEGNTFDLRLNGDAHLTVAPGARLVGSNVARIGNGSGDATLTVQGFVAEDYGIVQAATLDVAGAHAHWLSGDSGIALEGGTLVVEGGARLDTGGHLAEFPAAALDMAGNSTATVTGAGSTVRVSNTFVSTFGGTSSLTVQDGGQVYTGGAGIGGNGDGSLTVTGPGSLFQASRSVSIGGQVPVNSTVQLLDGGTMKANGVSLDGTLALDGTAHLATPYIVSGGGVIEALSGTVTLATSLELYYNLSDPVDTGPTFLEAALGATLDIAGPISTVIPGGSSALVEAGSGHIVLSHQSPTYEGTTGIYAATLEIASHGAIGSSELRFIGGSGQNPTLQIDAGIAFANPIGGFAAGDTIDLAGFASDLAGFRFTPTPSGGTLRLSNAAGQHQQLTFSTPNLTTADFALTADDHGGTAITHS